MPEKEYVERESLLENLHKFAPEHNTPLIQLLVTREPAADVAEIKRGEWKDKGNGDWSCTNCNEIFTLNVDMHPIHDCGLKFCPNCGADMRGKKNG